MISFQTCNGGKVIRIDCDDSGIDILLSVLAELRGSGSHVHLYAPAAKSDGRTVLSDKTPFGEEAVSEVIIGHGGD
jgi:hypothetical protein